MKFVNVIDWNSEPCRDNSGRFCFNATGISMLRREDAIVSYSAN